MRAVNLFLLTRNRNMEICSEYENVVSERKTQLKEHEYNSLCALVNTLMENGIKIADLDGFHFSYHIKQVPAEFDLLKVGKGRKVINIELKSSMIDEEKIEKQLIRNRHFLQHIADQIDSFTYVAATDKIYTIKDNKIEICSVKNVIESLESFEEYNDNIDGLFRAKDYLISPLNNPENFINRQYFLTDAQETIKKDILADTDKAEHRKFWGITGSAGTGKTLLLYDLARNLAERGKVCIIHCGILCAGHHFLNDKLENLTIIDAKSLKRDDLEGYLSSYNYILVDETQRIYGDSYNDIIKFVKENDLIAIFSYDEFQTLTQTETNRKIVERLKSIENFKEKKLTTKIRTNKEMAAFIKALLNLNDVSDINYKYEGISIVCANSTEETNKIIRYLRHNGYTFIEYTKSRYQPSLLDKYHGDINTHKVIGQEYDNVAVVMDENFMYSETGGLKAYEHPCKDYLFYKLFFQGVSRAREKLCIVVNNNPELLKKIIGIKYRAIQ